VTSSAKGNIEMTQASAPAVVCFGELLVDMVGAPGASLAQTPSFLKAPGGAPANVAVGVARQGVASRFVGQVGEDPFGEWLGSVLNGEGVDTRFLRRSSQARTTQAFVATRSDGLKDICFYRNPGADAQLAPGDLDLACLDGASILHCGSVSLSLSPCREAQLALVEEARRRGVAISYDPNWRPSLWEDHEEARGWLRRMLPLADVAKIADEELEFLCGTADVERAGAQVLEAGPKAVIITRGAQGAYFRCGEQSGFIPGFDVEAIDTLGAGDAFVASLLAHLAESESFARRDWGALDWGTMVRNANACGALATLKRGGIPSLPTREECSSYVAQVG
jgi:fructokinase